MIDSKILELRILSKDLFPNLALLQCHESDNQRALYSCVSCRVVNVVCLCVKQKHMHSTVSRRKRYKTGRPYKPCIKHICSKYCCFQSHIVLLKAFSLYLCFLKIITFFLIRVLKNEKKDLTRHFCQKIGRVGRVTLNTGIFFLALIEM